MAVWAYECRSCPPGHIWWVERTRADEAAPAASLLRVKVGAEWLCAIIDRSKAVAVDEQLVREAIASDDADCPECLPREVADPEPDTESESESEDSATVSVQAAAIALSGRRFVVILVPLDVVRSPGEAEMLLADLRPRLGDIELVLMGQEADGTPRYHGDTELLSLLADVPVDRMPWKVYALR